MKPRVRIVDTAFAHAPNSFGCGNLVDIIPNDFTWYRGSEQIGNVIVITESCFHLVDQCPEKIKIGLIIEPPQISPTTYSDIRNPQLNSKFDYILTYNRQLIEENPEKFKFYGFGGCWINPDDRKLYIGEKTKNVSIVASSKRSADGHLMRHAAIETYRDKIDGVFGNGYKFVENKLEALKEYRFSIAIENDNNVDMFSEKLIDCFLTGCIPIYYGCRGLANQYFDTSCMLIFNTLEELGKCLEQATEETYNRMMQNFDGIQYNWQQAYRFAVPENDIWSQHLSKYVNDLSL